MPDLWNKCFVNASCPVRNVTITWVLLVYDLEKKISILGWNLKPIAPAEKTHSNP
jgi:hypothetical protein